MVSKKKKKCPNTIGQIPERSSKIPKEGPKNSKESPKISKENWLKIGFFLVILTDFFHSIFFRILPLEFGEASLEIFQAIFRKSKNFFFFKKILFFICIYQYIYYRYIVHIRVVDSVICLSNYMYWIVITMIHEYLILSYYLLLICESAVANQLSWIVNFILMLFFNFFYKKWEKQCWNRKTRGSWLLKRMKEKVHLQFQKLRKVKILLKRLERVGGFQLVRNVSIW